MSIIYSEGARGSISAHAGKQRDLKLHMWSRDGVFEETSNRSEYPMGSCLL